MSMSIEEMIVVLEAARKGKKIEHKNHWTHDPKWELAPMPCWDFHNRSYRIAPLEKVKMWQWLYDTPGGSTALSHFFYENLSNAAIGIVDGKNLRKALWTEIQVDAQ